MGRSSGQIFQLTVMLIGRILSRPAWLMALFLLMACLLPFSRGTSPFRGDEYQIIDPFGFSLFSPSRRAFGPHSMLALCGFFIIPSALIYWRQSELYLKSAGNLDAFRGGVLPFAATSLYCLFLLVSLPLIARSIAIPGFAALGITILDLFLLAVMMSWIVDFTLGRTLHPRVRPLAGWIAAGVIFLARGMVDAFLISPQARELVEADWSAVAWHFLLAIVAVTIHALPLPSRHPVGMHDRM